MTSGPEHYREAERLLALSESELESYAHAVTGSEDETIHYRQSKWANDRAQVHATLALAAATICAGNARTEIRDDGSTVTDVAQGADWAEVLS